MQRQLRVMYKVFRQFDEQVLPMVGN